MRVLLHIVAFVSSAFYAACSLIPGYKKLKQGPYKYERKRHDLKYLDVFEAQPDARQSVLIFIHGGGWCSGTIESNWGMMFDYQFVGHAMASRGITTALISYPLGRVPFYIELPVYIAIAMCAVILAYFLAVFVFSVGLWLFVALCCYVLTLFLLKQRLFCAWPFDNTNGTFEKQIETIKKMVEYLRVLYPTAKFTVVGHSAGGHLAALLGIVSYVHISQIIGLSGVYNINDMWNTNVIARELLLRHLCSKQNISRFCPVSLLASREINTTTSSKRSFPEWVIVSSALDSPTLEDQADGFYNSLQKNYSRVNRLNGIGNSHGCGLILAEACWSVIEMLIRQQGGIKD